MLQQLQKFDLHSEFEPTGDQPQAIDTLVDGVNKKKIQGYIDLAESETMDLTDCNFSKD